MEAYRYLLTSYFNEFDVAVVAYCLMPNHVHLVVIPTTLDGLHRALRAVHSQYAQRVNRSKSQSGHLWQGRYFSSPLDTNYFLNAIRYVELNPVKARLAERAEDYTWSSAAAHCGLRHDPMLARAGRQHALAGIANWSRWLAEGAPTEVVETLRTHGPRNLPCGSSDFVASLEAVAGRGLRCLPRGRPPATRK